MATGQPLGPNAKKYVFHCGFLVRDRIPISAREWKERRSAPEISYVSNLDKQLVWDDIQAHFSFDTDDEELQRRIREWTMKKMATLFQDWKKKLYHNFVLKNETPDFNSKAYVKIRADWDEFVQYKRSQESEARVRVNKLNAAQKKYHHHLGSGGYKTALPKWERQEQEMLARGVVPETIRRNWSERSRNWFYAHGGTINPNDGELDWGPEISRAAQRLVQARSAVLAGEGSRWRTRGGVNSLF